MSEENKPISSAAQAPDPLSRRRRGSRGGRGRSRRRTDNPPGAPAPAHPAHAPDAHVPDADYDEPEAEVLHDDTTDFHEAPEAPEPGFDREPEAESAADSPAPAPEPEVREVRAQREPAPRRAFERPQRPDRGPRPPQPQSPPSPPPSAKQISAVSEAVEDVYRIVETLKRVMEELDELLETLELAERQKIEDERELDNLRRATRMFQTPVTRPRENNPPPQHLPSRQPQRFQNPQRRPAPPRDQSPRDRDRDQAPREQPPREQPVREQSPADPGEPPQT